MWRMMGSGFITLLTRYIYFLYDRKWVTYSEQLDSMNSAYVHIIGTLRIARLKSKCTVYGFKRGFSNLNENNYTDDFIIVIRRRHLQKSSVASDRQFRPSSASIHRPEKGNYLLKNKRQTYKILMPFFQVCNRCCMTMHNSIELIVSGIT